MMLSDKNEAYSSHEATSDRNVAFGFDWFISVIAKEMARFKISFRLSTRVPIVKLSLFEDENPVKLYSPSRAKASSTGLAALGDLTRKAQHDRDLFDNARP